MTDTCLQVFAPDALAGRRLLMTGASSGLGRAAAIAAARVGARVAITGRNAERLEATLAQLSGEGHTAFPGELSDADAAAELVKRAASEGGAFDGVFHAAGVFAVLPAKITKQKHIDQLFGASVPGAYGIARAVASKAVMNDGGSVAFMSSVAGVRGNAGLAVYAGAKAAILGLSSALAIEMAPRRIRVNAIVAGTVETEMHLKMQAAQGEGGSDANLQRHPLGYGRPDDVAAAVVFLMSDAARWITGTAFTVDGGYTA